MLLTMKIEHDHTVISMSKSIILELIANKLFVTSKHCSEWSLRLTSENCIKCSSWSLNLYLLCYEGEYSQVMPSMNYGRKLSGVRQCFFRFFRKYMAVEKLGSIVTHPSIVLKCGMHKMKRKSNKEMYIFIK